MNPAAHAFRRCGFCDRPIMGEDRFCDSSCEIAAKDHPKEPWPLPGPVRVVRNLNRRKW